MLDEDGPIIYGLDEQARCMRGYTDGVQETAQFIVGTQTLKRDNMLVVIDVDEESSTVTRHSYAHACGEVFDLVPSPSTPAVVATCHAHVAHDSGNRRIVHACSIWKLASHESLGNTQNNQMQELQKFTAHQHNLVCFDWHPVRADKALLVHDATHVAILDVTTEINKPICVYDACTDMRAKSGRAHCAGWDRHHNGNVCAVGVDAQVRALDTRQEPGAGSVYVLDAAHQSTVRTLEYNPLRAYILATGSDDACVRIWDARHVQKPLMVLPRRHSHWIWKLRYNDTHDQLLITCSSDAQVLLHSLVSLSSEALEQTRLTVDEDESENAELREGERSRHKPLIDGVLRRSGDEHEESVYACDWAPTDPWCYASLSYDGRLVIQRVPKLVKYNILQL